jgi:hypothetical protein
MHVDFACSFALVDDTLWRRHCGTPSV